MFNTYECKSFDYKSIILEKKSNMKLPNIASYDVMNIVYSYLDDEIQVNIFYGSGSKYFASEFEEITINVNNQFVDNCCISFTLILSTHYDNIKRYTITKCKIPHTVISSRQLYNSQWYSVFNAFMHGVYKVNDYLQLDNVNPGIITRFVHKNNKLSTTRSKIHINDRKKLTHIVMLIKHIILTLITEIKKLITHNV